MMEIEELKNMEREGRRGEAIRLLEAEIASSPENTDLWLLWGEMLYADGKMSEALNKFNTVLRLDPTHAKATNYVTMINGILDYYCKDMFNP